MTPCSTPGKLTPTRHLLLTSPAKRQLNFGDTEKKEQGSRSRTVSETIKEVGPGLETDYSPHTSTTSLAEKPCPEKKQDVTSVEENRESEHEKSDSEQEKDITPVNEKSDEKESGDEANETVSNIIDQVVEIAVSDTEQSKIDNSVDIKHENSNVKPESSQLTVENKPKKNEERVVSSKNKRSRVRAGVERGRVGLVDKNKASTSTNTTLDKNKPSSSSTVAATLDKGKVLTAASSCPATATRIEFSAEKPKASSKASGAATLSASKVANNNWLHYK